MNIPGIRSEYRFFCLALAVSLVLHGFVLTLKLQQRAATAPPAQASTRDSRLDVTLQATPRAEPPPQQAPKSETPRDRRPAVLTAKPRSVAPVEPAPSWTQDERDAMDNFLNELAVEAKPKSGRELANKALAMAGKIGRQPAQEDTELQEMRQKFANAQTDPYSIELYFDALFRKMNRSAAMVPLEKRSSGRQVAAVRVVVDQSGAVKSFRVLWASDQQLEIDYIRRVIEMAAPFPVFPSDIRKATDSVVLQICILPNGAGNGGGAAFSRMASGQSCQVR